ncbi:hypothetical protein [Desulfovibrio sp. ZJ200]|uniref:hypothetical protein n=1 Tax=Desulfovibrio sp. ZJ200 TaxID=2709792 RepID=UPI0013EA6112|nr:hypothetical protein [Desulfovibrio sp. ZJ200]
MFFPRIIQFCHTNGADITRGYIREYCFDKIILDKNDILDSIKKDKSYFLSGFSSVIYKISFLEKWKINFGKYISRSADTAFLLHAVAASNFVAVRAFCF